LPTTIQEARSATPLGRFGTTQEVADVVVFVCLDEAAYITGSVVGVDGGLVMM
jgi:3-oxoacyl-[acyl-carrier protein] reductase